MTKILALLFLSLCFSAASYGQVPASPPAQCAATPGNTVGPYRSLCATSAGGLYVCANASGCTASGDWVAAGGGGTVSSVFSRTGAVTATTGDYTAAQVTNAVDQTGSYSNPGWIAALAATKLTGTVPCAQLPALTGDATTSAGSCATTVGKINGVALSGLATGILKNTTTTGVPSIAVAADFPTLNQNTTGTAANLSGTPALPNGTTATTQTQADNSTKLATTAYVDAGLSPKAPLASPALTGTPTAPTPTTGDNSTKIATTAYVDSHFGGGSGNGTVVLNGSTSGTVAVAVANAANNGGTAIAYILPSTAGSAGQVMSDAGVVTCPTLPSGAPSLCHQMQWVAQSSGSGGPLASSKVSTAQSTSSTSYVDLTTADTVTFTLSGASKVLVQYSANLSINTLFTCGDTINIDGTNITDGGLAGTSDWGEQSINSGYNINSSWQYITTSLGSGSHTIKVQHKAFGNTCTWANRTLVAWTTP